MTDIGTIAATLLTNFATIRLRRCEQLWTWPVANPSLEDHCKFVESALRRQNVILRCNHQHLRLRLLDAGYRAFFDRLESDGPENWRLHFFCLDPSALTVLRDAGLGEYAPGETVHFDAEAFVVQRLRQLERCRRLDQHCDWPWWSY